MDNGSPATDNATNNAATNTLSSTNLVNLVKPLVSSTNPPSEFSRRNPRTLPPLAMNEGSPAKNINKAKTNTLSSTNVVKLVEPLVSSTNPPSEFPLRTPPLLNGFPGMENGLGYLLPANVVPWTNPPATRSPASDLLFPSPQMLVEYFKPVPGRTNGPNARVFVPVGFVPPTPAVTTPGSRATYTSP